MSKAKIILSVSVLCLLFGTVTVSANTSWHYSPYMVAQAFPSSGLKAAVDADSTHFTQCQIKRLKKSSGEMVFVDGYSACGQTAVENTDSFNGQQYIGYAQALYYSNTSPYSYVSYAVYANSDAS